MCVWSMLVLKDMQIKTAQQTLGDAPCKCLLFGHAMSGCDTTSALYGMGGLKQLKLLQTSQQLISDVLIFEHLLAIESEWTFSGDVDQMSGCITLHVCNLSQVNALWKDAANQPRTSAPKKPSVCICTHIETLIRTEDFGFNVLPGANSNVPMSTDTYPAPSQSL